MNNRLGLALIILGVLALDQATKLLVSSQMVLGESIPVIPGVFHLTLVRNSGMAFGLLSAATIPFKPVLVTLLSIIALSAVAIYAISAPASERLSQFGLAFILGGAAGNIIDRVRLGYVIDFIDVFFRGSHWPAFNVADTAICTGVGLLLVETLFHRHPRKATTEAGSES
jgi:signal peptidase II